MAFNVQALGTVAYMPRLALMMEMENYELVDRVLAQRAQVPLQRALRADIR